MTIKKLLLQRRIKKIPTDLSQIDLWLTQSNQDLKLAKKLAHSDPSWSLTITYQAMLRAGRALIYSSGYLPRSSGSHKTTVEFTQIILDKNLKPLVNSFERLRRKRHDFFYNIPIGSSLTEVNHAIKNAHQLIKTITHLIQAKHQQLNLKIK